MSDLCQTFKPPSYKQKTIFIPIKVKYSRKMHFMRLNQGCIFVAEVSFLSSASYFSSGQFYPPPCVFFRKVRQPPPIILDYVCMYNIFCETPYNITGNESKAHSGGPKAHSVGLKAHSVGPKAHQTPPKGLE